MDWLLSTVLAALVGFVFGLQPVPEALNRGKELLIKRTLERVLAPDHMSSAEMDPYFNRECAKPEH